MAIYHMQAKVVSRGSGRSAVAASAYMSCSRMYNDYDGIQHDYTRKQGLIYQEVMLPPMAPSEWNDREQLWNAVEETEKTKDSRLAREFVVALPVELDKNSNISLLQDFIQKNFVDMGMCADFAIHDTDGHNPHAHILLTVRPLNENGTWQYKTEKEYLCIKDGEEKGFTASEFKTAQKQGWEKQYRYKVGKKKEYLTSSAAQEKGYERIDKHPKSSRYGRQNPISEQWNSDEQLCIWRANWADAVNKMIKSNDINRTIVELNYQGITLSKCLEYKENNLTVPFLLLSTDEQVLQYNIKSAMHERIKDAINKNNLVIEESYNNNKTSIILENELKKYSDDNPINRYILMKRMEKIGGYNIENFTEDFNLLNNLGKIGINNFGVYYKKDSIRDYIKQNYDEKISCILLDRLDGLTLEEIGEKNDITRERVRQICKKQFDRIISLNYYEDKYSDVFEKYEWTKKLFCELFNLDSYVYEFLNLKYEKGKENINGILFDDEFNDEIKNKYKSLNNISIKNIMRW